MALATTTLSSAVALSDGSIVVASATSVAAGRLVIVDQEIMQVGSSYVSGTTVPVQRGQLGSATATHVSGANVTHGAPSDFGASQAGEGQALTYPVQPPWARKSYSASGAISLPTPGQNMHAILNGTSVLAMTIAAPTKDMDGCMLLISGNGAAAHTVTVTGGMSGAGTSYDVVTVNATAPISFMLVAVNGLWQGLAAIPLAGTVTNVTGTLA